MRQLLCEEQLQEFLSRIRILSVNQRSNLLAIRSNPSLANRTNRVLS